MSETEILEKIKSAYQSILGDSMTGIYVHGSIALGCFNWDKSDIDFIVVVKEAVNQSQKEALIQELIDLDEVCPPKGLEMSVVLEQVCSPFVYPTPFELHFSNAHKENARNNLAEYCRNMNGTDVDLAAHFTVIGKAGQVLCGKPVSEVFAPVPRECYLDSIRADVEGAVEEIVADPVYYILNLCRVLAYLEQGMILSKQQGGEWGIAHLPEIYGPMLVRALECYGSNRSFRGDHLLERFAEEMLGRMKSIWESEK